MPNAFLPDPMTLKMRIIRVARMTQKIGRDGNSNKWIALLADGLSYLLWQCERPIGSRVPASGQGQEALPGTFLRKADTTARKMAADAAAAVRGPLQE
jgi:hypothetical protein